MGVLSKKMNLKKLLAPSTCGAIAGFVVGLIPQIRNAVIGDAAPLHVIQDTALILGDGAVPLLTLIMGGNLLKGLRVSVVPKSILAGIIVVKYIAMPVIGIGVVKGASWLGLVHDDPLYKFVLLLHFALPPAMNIGKLIQQVMLLFYYHFYSS
uniref:Auxin efflux carrier family protein n=2 Tax=Solanum tuberosum TaxID=4113 RepID=M1CVG2_SOLTU